jgi:RNA polymerase sigma-70 factor (ECF subfamily)
MFERKEIMEDIRASIAELPESYRSVLILRYQMDMKNAEIAQILGVSKENVEVRIHRARKALRKVLLQRWEERGVIKHEVSAF